MDQNTRESQDGQGSPNPPYDFWDSVERLADANTSEAAAAVLAQSKDMRAWPFLLEAAGSLSSSVSDPARRALATYAPEVGPYLLDKFRQGTPKERSAALLALAELRDLSTYDTLLQGLRDEEESVRSNAVRALCAFGDVRALPVLIERLRDSKEDYLVHKAIANHLHELPGDEKTAAMLEIAGDRRMQSVIRCTALLYLELFEDTSVALPVLRRLRWDLSPEVRKAAQRMLRSTSK